MVVVGQGTWGTGTQVFFVSLGGTTGRCPRHLSPNPVKIAAAIHKAGAYNLKKGLPRHVLQRRQPPQINLPAGTLE